MSEIQFALVAAQKRRSFVWATTECRRGSCSVAGGYWMITAYQYCIDRQKQRQSNGCVSNNETTEHVLMIENVVMTTY